MVQEEPAGAGEPVSLGEVGGEPGTANVFEHAHAHDLVEDGSPRQVAVVADLYASTVREPGFGDSRAGEGCLVLARRHAAPGCPLPAAYVQQALTGFQPELAADEIRLRLLGSFDVLLPRF